MELISEWYLYHIWCHGKIYRTWLWLLSTSGLHLHPVLFHLADGYGRKARLLSLRCQKKKTWTTIPTDLNELTTVDEAPWASETSFHTIAMFSWNLMNFECRYNMREGKRRAEMKREELLPMLLKELVRLLSRIDIILLSRVTFSISHSSFDRK